MIYRIGTRKSQLATVQANWVKAALEGAGLPCELVLIDSAGDTDKTTPLYEIESSGPGLFTKNLERALLENRIDLAVHSLKDLPTEQPAGLRVVAIPKREDPSDVLVVRTDDISPGSPLEVRAGAVVGTSSLRREAQLKAYKPDVQIVSIRGNLPTRLQAVRDRKVDAVVLAVAGLSRISTAENPPSLDGLTLVPLPSDTFVPAPGQGALGIEVSEKATGALLIALAKIHDDQAAAETRIERAILRALEGGCTLPLGVRCTLIGGTRLKKEFKLTAFLGVLEEGREPGPEGSRVWSKFRHFDIGESTEDNLIKKTVAYFKEVLNGGK